MKLNQIIQLVQKIFPGSEVISDKKEEVSASEAGRILAKVPRIKNKRKNKNFVDKNQLVLI